MIGTRPYNVAIALMLSILPSNAIPAMAYAIGCNSSMLLARNESTVPLDSPDSPQGLDPYIQLTIPGVILIVLVVLLVWYFCRRPFSSPWVKRQPGSSGAGSSSSTVNSTSDTEMGAVRSPFSFDSKKPDRLGEDCYVDNGEMEKYFPLPPAAALTRNPQRVDLPPSTVEFLPTSS